MSGMLFLAMAAMQPAMLLVILVLLVRRLRRKDQAPAPARRAFDPADDVVAPGGVGLGDDDDMTPALLPGMMIAENGSHRLFDFND